ncbi:hypothetical protein Clacol_008309 [Clathrus columnatus]|uniref:NAD-dependent epimerase/dehydratase domain-containing protein n=1 Tax=Clathrus columnatus TaxID=1419009 RepID=A0AAV5AK52_9AGAM|nr:hypothetical protein Clacol_008309 [Clathrus columnatus]
MPSVTSGKVLVTGASSFIATWIVKAFLDAGFTVRGTVRSTSKGEALKEIFKTDKFEYSIVEDILNDALFDKSLKDIDVVIHAASPLPGPDNDPQADPEEFIRPAVDGTVGILKSVLRAGETIKRVIIISSLAAIRNSGDLPELPVYDESNWPSRSLKIVETKGRAAENFVKYAASKILAEKAAWELYNPIKKTLKWDLVALNPTFVLGPILEASPTTDISKVYGPNFYLWTTLHGKPTPPGGYAALDFWVDVRDVAEAHLKAVTIEEAADNRFLILSDRLIPQDLLDAVHENDSAGEFDSLVRGTPGSGKDVEPFSFQLSNKKSQQVLGIKYRTIQDSAKDFARTVNIDLVMETKIQ